MSPEELAQRITAIESMLSGFSISSVVTNNNAVFNGQVHILNRGALPTNCDIGDIAIRNGSAYVCWLLNTWRILDGRSWVAIATASSYALDVNTYRALSITALAGTINTLDWSGTLNNFDPIIIRIKDNGSPQTITWSTNFVSYGSTLPTTTVAGKILSIGFLYDSVSGKLGCVAVQQQP